MTLLIALLIFSALIFIHELGHFLVAKRVGIAVHEFSIGMGPVIFATQKDGTQYSLRAFPIGGFVRMAGMDPEEADHPEGFNRKSVGQRMAVIFAGPFMNFLLSLLLFVFVFMVIGTPSHSNVVGGVIPGRPADKAGIQKGDRIIAINGQKVNDWDDLVNIIYQNPGQSLRITVLRNGNRIEKTVTPELDPEANVGLIGIKQAWEKQGFISSIILGLKQAYAVTVVILTTLILMITGQVPPEIAGPVGVVQMIGQAARSGTAIVLNFAGILSLHLGLLNLFPIPALDGSRLVFLAIEGLRGKPLNREKENFIHLIGFALLMILMIIITYRDILRILG
ncbi:RIP metalloprotease RseP [Calderihabitans maritimus]|uniref:Zinc metalloprotease n=1 Tax=Calderihabitans maritimus TaxID=1246530 RepID=A0A1Z5HXQ2_9FIRM|nr:RIP metalloprotease RseP [Calderihabitans maritimus]GAW94313.1 peptidase RseP [Calderihabitans maritimus]